MAAVPFGLITLPFIENVNKFQNPFRRSLVFIFDTTSNESWSLFIKR